MKKSKITASLAITLCVLVAASSITYSWIRRRWTPRLFQDNIKIESGGSLSFVINNTMVTEADMRSLLPGLNGGEDITLKPVSNYSGRGYDFFNIVNNSEGQLVYQHLPESKPETAASTLSTLGYLDFTFKLKNANPDSGKAQYIFLSDVSTANSSGSKITGAVADGQETPGDGYKAVRVAIGFGKAEPRIFVCDYDKDERTDFIHTGINNSPYTVDKSVYVADGTYYYRDGIEGNLPSTTCAHNGAPLVIENPNYYKLSDFNARNSIEYLTQQGGEPIPTLKEKYDVKDFLYVLAAGDNSGIDVYVRIWLEGTDDLCTGEIGNDLLDIVIKFDAVQAN